jgi:maltose alpha-D-glucosyltransferase/alpha-amylase
MANFLDNDPDRIGLAFSVLMSMPGIPIIYYGDEIGAQNNWKYARESEAMREDMAKKKGADKDVISFFDSRDINRGPVTGNAFYSAEKNPNEFSGKIYAKTKKLISLRKSNPVVNRGVFEKIETPNKEVFAYLRTYKNESMLIVNNLSNKSTVSKLNIPAKAVKKVKQKALTDLISNKQIQIKKNSQKLYELELKPYQSVWLKL